MRTEPFWVVSLAGLLLNSTPLLAQLDVTLVPTVETAEKGKVFEINVTFEAQQAITDVSVVPLPPESFCVRATPVGEGAVYAVTSDGSAEIATLGEASALTVQFRVQAPTQLFISRQDCGEEKRTRTADNTRDTRVFIFNGRYRLAGDTSWVSWTESVEVRYTTSQAIFLWAGMLGVILGYVVKSLTSRKAAAEEAIAARVQSGDFTGVSGLWHRLLAILFFLVVQNIDRLLTALVLGFAALLTVQQSGVPVGGFAAAMLAGISVGVIADDAIISRLKE